MIVEIPIISDPAFTFSTQLGDVNATFDFQWNDRTSQYSLSLSDDTGLVYFQGVPVVLGTDLLDPYNYGIGSLVVVDTSNLHIEATVEDFGGRIKMYWLSADEVPA